MIRPVSLILCILFLVTLPAATTYGRDGACTFSVSPDTVHFFDIFGGSAEVRVKASSPTCTFTAKTEYPWIAISVAQAQGEGKVSVTVGGNDSLTHRIGSLLIDGEEVTVIQNGPHRGGSGN
jgi:hypothetical protein